MRIRRLMGTMATGTAIVAVSAAIFGAAAWRTCVFEGCPDVSHLGRYVPDESSVVLDREGHEVARLFETRRTVVSLEELPPYVPAAFIAMEDHRFYRHGGVDWIRVGGAMLANLKAGGVREGGSTITMQLARNLFPEQLPPAERTIVRKLKEMRVARMVEGELDKRRILELYLNQIYFGEGAYGVDAAAREYFGIPARALTLAQAATLAALPRAPARYDPRDHPDASRTGRGTVLRRMAGTGAIPPAAADSALAQAVAVVPDTLETERAAWFVEEVRRQLQAELGHVLYTGGLRIHTTLDPNAQEALEEELERQSAAIEAGRLGRFRARPGEPLEHAGIVMDARTGDVLALVGGRDFAASKFNRVSQAWRQPGSAFKPVVFAAALDAGRAATDVISDEPLAVRTADGVWSPRNYSRDHAAVVSMAEALARSRNVPTVRLAHDVGLGNVARLAERLGIAPHVPAYPSLPLGTVETTPLALTTAYAAFANLGQRPRPRLVVRVEDRRGDVVWTAPPAQPTPVMSEATAFLTLDLLRGVVDGGTGWQVRRAGYRGPAAGKTGTTQDGADLWFAGVTPSLAATIWFGFDQRRTVVTGGTGGAVAAPVWGRVMRRIAPADEPGWTAPPGLDRVRVDALGTVLARGCPGIGPVREVWVRAGPFGPHGECPALVAPAVLEVHLTRRTAPPIRAVAASRSPSGIR